MTIIVECDYCGKREKFKDAYVPNGWHFEAFDTIIHYVVWKHVCPECWAKNKETKE